LRRNGPNGPTLDDDDDDDNDVVVDDDDDYDVKDLCACVL
jgi:hypothetical protein